MPGNPIFGALEDFSVDWGVFIRDLVQQLAAGIMKTKPSPVCPYLFYLYQSGDCIMEQEEIDYEAAKE